jgi:hypothetical protein
VLPARAGPQHLISGVLAVGKLRAMLPAAAGRVLGQFACTNRGVTKSHSAFVTEAAPVERVLICPSVRRHARG